MPIKLHLFVTVVSRFVFAAVGFFGTLLLFIIYLDSLPDSIRSLLNGGFTQFLVLAAGGSLGWRAPKWVMYHLIGANCPKCRQTIYPHEDKQKQMIYACNNCHYVYETGMAESFPEAD